MERLGSDLLLRARMAQAARQRAHEQFDWDKRGVFITELYQGLSGA
jgi:glycosyltransferase involved in cell wall biosynthesis